MKVSTGTFTLYFDWNLFLPVYYNNVCNYREAELYSMWWIKEPTRWEGNTIRLFRHDGNAEENDDLFDNVFGDIHVL